MTDSHDVTARRADPIGTVEEREEETGLDLLVVGQALWRHRYKIILAVILALVLAHLYLKTVRPLFTARAEILVEETQSPVDLGQVFGGSNSLRQTILTELQVARSRALMRTVIDRLGLINDPEFNPWAAEADESALDKLLGPTGFWPVKVESYWPPSVKYGPEARPQITTPPPFERQLRVATDRLHSKIRVGALRDTFIIWIMVEAWSPGKAALIANTLSQAYIDQRLQVKFDAQAFASEFIGERVVDLREQVERADAAVQAFRSENSLVDENDLEVARYEEMKRRVDAAAAIRNDLQDRVSKFENALGRGEDIASAARFLRDRRLDALITAGYSDAIRLEANETVDQLRAELALASRRSEALETSLNGMETSLREEANNLVRLKQLEREAEASKVLFQTFLSRQKETDAQQGLLTADARLLTTAEAPYRPSSPDRLAIQALSGLAGLLLACGLVFVLERGRNRFVTIEELESWSGYAVLGSIPLYQNSNRRGDVLQHARENPGGALAEAARSLRTSILLANVDEPPQVITLTSSVPEEGKSLTSILLAMVTAQMGKSALLIDADLRRRTLHDTLKLNSDVGLISVLEKRVTLDDAIQIEPHTGLHALPVEKNRVSAPDLLSSNSFADMIAQARLKYDMIILDAPPVLPVTDARILAKSSDALIYVVRWNDTPREIVKHGLSSMAALDLHISGLVLSRVDRKKQKQYGYGDYGYYGYGVNKYYRRAERYYTDK